MSQGRLQDIEQMSAADRESLTIEVVTPGTVRGTIDRKTLPEITGVALSPTTIDLDRDFYHAFFSARDTSYEIRNVPPGNYQLQVYGERVRSRRSSGCTHEVVQRHNVEVRPGETPNFDLGARK